MAEDSSDTTESGGEETPKRRQRASGGGSRSSGGQSGRSSGGGSQGRSSQQSGKGKSRSRSQQTAASGQGSEQPQQDQESGGDGGGGADESQEGQRPSPPKKMRGPELVTRARDLLRETTGRQPESVSGLERDAAGWRVTFELLELSRIPPTTDVLGTYHVDVTEDGELAGLTRSRRYYRSQAEGGEGG